MNRLLSLTLRRAAWTGCAWTGCAWIACAAQAASGAAAPEAPASRTPPARAIKGTTPDGPWVIATQKHGGPGVRLSYRAPARLQAGEPATLELRLSGVSGDDVSVTWRAPDDSRVTVLQVSSSGSRTAELDGQTLHLPRGQITTLSLRIVPGSEGSQTLDLFTTQGARQGVQSVALQVGRAERRLKAIGLTQTTPGGEAVISLPSTPSR